MTELERSPECLVRADVSARLVLGDLMAVGCNLYRGIVTTLINIFADIFYVLDRMTILNVNVSVEQFAEKWRMGSGCPPRFHL